MDSFLIMELKIVFTILKHVTFLRIMTLTITNFEKIEIYDRFYNCLLCVIKVFFFFQSSSHIQKDVFYDQYLIERCTNILDMKKKKV
jgi:hypothetical protein